MAPLRTLLLSPILLVALALAGCSDSDPDPDPTPSPSASPMPGGGSGEPGGSGGSSSAAPVPQRPSAPQTVQKDIMDTSFPDGTFTVWAGDTVQWTNKGTLPHSVTSDAFDSSPNCPPLCILPGQSFSATFPAAGTYAYHSKVNPTMTGTLTVV